VIFFSSFLKIIFEKVQQVSTLEEEESDESNEKLEEEDGRMPLTYDADGMLDASQMTDEQKEQLNAILSSMY
jgi:hypothetical protein